MKMPICSRCKKNIAVIFISKMEESGKTQQEGICMKCAREMGLKPLDNLMQSMGISEEDMEAMSSELDALTSDILNEEDEEDEDTPQTIEDLPGGDEEEDDEEPSRTRSFPPVFDQLFAALSNVPEQGSQPEAPQQTAPKQTKKPRPKYLTKYCRHLTDMARMGRLDRVVGRERETERVIQILNRRQKNNPCLIGEPGVGKTAVAEGLAMRIASGNVPDKLQDKEVYMLDLTALVAGTQFRGQFESRIKKLIDEVRHLGNILLVIDEVHSIVGTGGAEGALDAANILKPALSRGEVQVIGATTFAEYRKYIEKDSALERRFQPVHIEEPTVAQTAEILQGVRGYYEQFHGVTISDEICVKAAQLSERYITDRFLPDKAIDLLDEACSKINMQNKILTELPKLRKEIASVQEHRDEIQIGELFEQDYAELAELKSQELQLSQQLNQMLDELRESSSLELTEEDLARVIAMWTGIPAHKIQQSEQGHLKQLDEKLKTHIIGQDEAVQTVCDTVRRARMGISPKRKPASFLFVGPTGVGKTELVKRLAEELFDMPDALIRFDMSEFMEKHTISRLIGSPPGYVGYDEAGQLTEKVRRRPYCVILLDEIEKAHPDILNLFLQILDDGRATDAGGRTVNFENTILIMTSNAGSHGTSSPVGFGQTASEATKQKAMTALEAIMRPEFLNRIDEIIAFRSLSREDFARIAGILLDELKTTLAEKSIDLRWDETLIAYLVDKAFTTRYGARALRRQMEKEVENAIASAMVNAETPLLGIHLSAQDGTLKLDAI